MKNKYLILPIIALTLIFIASCAVKQQQSTAAYNQDQQASPAPKVQKQGISPDVQELLDKSKTKVQNIYYLYKAPQTGDNFYEFYIRGSKIKYLPYREINALDRPESYNAIYIDKITKTAQEYCDDRACVYKGKKAELSYSGAYIFTMFDWLDSITTANKVGEEVIDDRSTWKVETDKGTFWLDTFYGIPLKIQAKSSGNIFRFQQLNVNGVQNSDVTYS